MSTNIKKQCKNICFGINNLMHLVNNLNIYSELVSNLVTQNCSSELLTN